MRTTFATAALITCVMATPASGEWKLNGKPVPDTSWRQQKDGFGVFLHVIDNPRQFNEDWLKPTKAVRVSDTGRIKRHSTALFVIIFNGCPENENGHCDVVADFRNVKPDGTNGGLDVRDAIFWRGKAAPDPPKIERATTAFEFEMDDSDPAGEWKIQVLVKDRVKGITFELEQRFTVE